MTTKHFLIQFFGENFFLNTWEWSEVICLHRKSSKAKQYFDYFMFCWHLFINKRVSRKYSTKANVVLFSFFWVIWTVLQNLKLKFEINFLYEKDNLLFCIPQGALHSVFSLMVL